MKVKRQYGVYKENPRRLPIITPLVKRVMLDPTGVEDIGQFTKEQLRELDRAVKYGALKKEKGGAFPKLKWVYALPNIDIQAQRKAWIKYMMGLSTTMPIGKSKIIRLNPTRELFHVIVHWLVIEKDMPASKASRYAEEIIRRIRQAGRVVGGPYSEGTWDKLLREIHQEERSFGRAIADNPKNKITYISETTLRSFNYSEKPFMYEGRAYRVGKLSSGEWYLEPYAISLKRKETDPFPKGTIWLKHSGFVKEKAPFDIHWRPERPFIQVKTYVDEMIAPHFLKNPLTYLMKMRNPR